MKKYYLYIITFLYAVSLFSAPVSEKNAKTVALNFFKVNNQLLSDNSDITLEYKCISKQTSTAFTNNSNELTYYYVFNKGTKGFIIISADDATYPVLAYSNESAFYSDKVPENVAKWLEGYKQQIRFIIENNISATDEIRVEWSDLKSGKDISNKLQSAVQPLVQTKWNQAPYYNTLCPFDYNYNERTVTGCTATAMAQILKFWNYPKTGTGFHSYDHNKYGKLSANFGSTNYDWASMPNSINSNNDAIATLMYQCGVSVEMNYNVAEAGGSGAYVISSASPVQHCVEYALKTYFGYAPTLQGLIRQNYSDTDWKNLLKTDLNAGRPIQYAGFGQGGHTFVCDGYENNDFFHMNWGWGGMYDGYFNLNSLNPGTGGAGSGAGTYNSGQQALIGIQPPANSSSYNLNIYLGVVTNKPTIAYGEGFTITTDIVNEGTSDFSGDYCAAVFDENDIFTDFVEIKTGNTLPPNNHYINGITFTTTGILSMLPGTYKVYIFYRPTGGNWSGLKASSWDLYADIFTEIKVVNYNNIQLYANFGLNPSTNIFQGGSLSVTLDIGNFSTQDFTGIFDVSLYKITGEFVETIEQKTGMNLATNMHYSNGLNFTTNELKLEPGTYLLALEHKRDGGNWELTGSSDTYINPIKVIIQKAPYQADIYEINNDLASSSNLSVNFSNNNAIVKTTGSNFHIGSDWDFYKINLQSGYNYSIDARLQDNLSSNDGKSYTVDAIFANSTDGTTWSDAYDDVMPSTIHFNGGGTIYFVTSPYFLGETGTYSLDISISRTQTNSVADNYSDEDLVKLYPNPASESLYIDFSKNLTTIKSLKMFDIKGKLVYENTSLIGQNNLLIPLDKYQDGSYYIEIIDFNGKIINKNLTVIK
ncbi:MAG: thiol protease/hemagglutinin PrtT [Bacteroidota bacterium]